ncbi:hypothetical protein DFR58_10389 [Anaerobacterium chartisolvens]|uniref:Uncharacterized protein n=1 Tax=Anaerobacterium chartisolvens TaxID=1297424 RepID=A0A369BI33_9FIRM|nr:hypothetical protein [Anaerobacterium chartisolvens]RCX19344.1 hypothetical protein DFR58_10389 [Anaerobacterium chartisolvens]
MVKKTKADIYLAHLERIIAGKKDVEPVEDIETKEILSLARTMLAADFSSDIKIREKLMKRILTEMYEKDKSSLEMLLESEDELDEEALEHVAAGFAGKEKEQKDIINGIMLPGNKKTEL